MANKGNDTPFNERNLIMKEVTYGNLYSFKDIMAAGIVAPARKRLGDGGAERFRGGRIHVVLPPDCMAYLSVRCLDETE